MENRLRSKATVKHSHRIRQEDQDNSKRTLEASQDKEWHNTTTSNLENNPVDVNEIAKEAEKDLLKPEVWQTRKEK